MKTSNFSDAQKAFTFAVSEATALHSRDAEWRARFGLAQADAKQTRGELEKAIAVIESLGPLRDEEGDGVNLLSASQLRERLARGRSCSTCCLLS